MARFSDASYNLELFRLGDEEAETKSIFVKVPLKDDPTFASVNVRELVMFTDVLPKLQVRL